MRAEEAGKYYVPHDSKWPIIGSFSFFTLLLGAIALLNHWSSGWAMLPGFALVVYMFIGWFTTVIDENQKSRAIADGPSPDVRTDPARPGFAVHRMWVVDGFPAKIVYETLQLSNVLVPPAKGSVLNVFTFPPDESWKGKVGEREVRAYFQAMGAPNASTYSANAPHPYMQKTRTLDICIVLEGEIVLVLDTQEVTVKQGDFVINRGVNHAWSNRSGKPAVVSIAAHDGK